MVLLSQHDLLLLTFFKILTECRNSVLNVPFQGHAKPWTFKDYKAMVMGERVQIDHMTVTKNGICFKHFQAWDRRSKFIDANVYSDAKSSSAKRFLLDFVKRAPYIADQFNIYTYLQSGTPGYR